MNTRVKICGISEADTLEVAIEAGADMVGFVCFPRSPRHVSPKQASALAGLLEERAQAVLLTVDAADDVLETMVAAVRPSFVQAHGHESPERVAEIASRFSVPVIKAIRVSRPGDIARAADYDGAAAMVLFDAAAPPTMADALPGGNGLSFDWSLLSRYRVTADRPFMLSGGLTSDNVAEAIRVTNAPIVDVSSGVEIAPGRKDGQLIRNFIEAAKRAG